MRGQSPFLEEAPVPGRAEELDSQEGEQSVFAELSDRLVPTDVLETTEAWETDEAWSEHEEPEVSGSESLITFTARALPVKISVFVTPAARRATKVEVLLFVHGLDVCGPVLKNRPQTFITHPPFRLGDIASACGRPLVLVVPYFDWEHRQRNKMVFGHDWHKLAKADVLNSVLEEVMARAGAPGIERLILAGHSRAYGFFDALASQHAHPAMSTGALARLSHIWALDSTYTSPIADWRAWIQSRDGIHATVIYRYGTYWNKLKQKVALATGLHGKRFDDLAGKSDGRLRTIPVAAGKVDHCGLPGKVLPALLSSLSTAPAPTPEAEAFAFPEMEDEDFYAGDVETAGEMDAEETGGEVLERDALEADSLELLGEELVGPAAPSVFDEWEAAEEQEEEQDVLEAMDVHELEESEDQESLESEAELEEEAPDAGVLESSALTASELKAVRITSTLETGRPGGFSGLSGNFDGQGLSFGLVNWTMGTGSLQPLLREFAAKEPERWSRIFGPHAASFLALISRKDKDAIAEQLRFAVEEMNQSRIVQGKRRWAIKDPWATYFQHLAQDPAFQRIQVGTVRGLLDRARYFCEYFGLKSERAFAFMFDAVSSHGPWWLTKRFKQGGQRRRLLLRERLKALEAEGKGKVSEEQLLLAIAEVLAATSGARWREKVLARKRWFVTGQHPRAAELKGLTPSPDIPYARAVSRETTELLEATDREDEVGGLELESAALTQASSAGTLEDRQAIAKVLAKNHTDAATWFADVVPDATFLGRRIRPSGGRASGVHRTMLDALQRAERTLLGSSPGKTAAGLGKELGIYDIAGIRPPKKATGGTLPSYHCFGLAVDINHDTNPFVGNMSPRKQAARYQEYAANRSPRIIERAVWLLHGERFDVEDPKTIPARASDVGLAWDAHHRASQALASYLRLADDVDGEQVGRLVAAAQGRGDGNGLGWWKRRIVTDRGMIKRWDFQHHPRPEKVGYLDLPRELVVALVGAGLTWGGQYRGAKDIMHFDLRGPIKYR